MHIAIDSNQKSIALLLIRSGINVNLKDELGNTALHVAVMRNQPEIVDALLQAKADMNVLNQSYGRTPLGTAVADDNIIISIKPLSTAVCNGDPGAVFAPAFRSFPAMIMLSSATAVPSGVLP